MIPTSLVLKILLPILHKWSFPFPFFLTRFPSQTTFPPPTSVVATLRSQLLPNQSWPGDTVMPVIRPDPRFLFPLFQTDQESRGVIRERGCYAIDRSLTRALVSSTLVLI